MSKNNYFSKPDLASPPQFDTDALIVHLHTSTNTFSKISKQHTKGKVLEKSNFIFLLNQFLCFK